MPPPKAPCNIRLSEFPYEKIQVGSTVQFLGKRNSGKTHAMIELMERMSDKFKLAFVFSPTEKTCQYMRQCMPSWCVFNLNLEILENVLKAMKERNNAKVARGEEMDQWLLVIDDCAMNKKFMTCQSLLDLFMNGRHIGCTLFMTVQYMKSAEISLRQNQDFLFAFYETNKKVRRDLKDEYFSALDKDFDFLFDKHTEMYSALVAVRTGSASRNPADNFFYKRSKKEDPPHFFIGSKDMEVLNCCYYQDPNNIEPSVVSLPSISPFAPAQHRGGPSFSERPNNDAFDLDDFEFDEEDEDDQYEE